jgi:phosphatidylglycerol:prolipoprotein diacylglycerol transferase
MNWWQHLPEKMSPVIFSVGSFQLRWYGMMYIVAITIVYFLVMYRYRTESIRIQKQVAQDWFAYAILGVLLGGRIGYVIFYDPWMVTDNPLGILIPFDVLHGFKFTGFAGMSFHGGVIGVFLMTWLYCRKNKVNFWEMTDLVVPAIPLGYTFGRLGNFINGELYGRVTNVAWGMVFPGDPSGQLRHPSQLYEAFFEGVVLFVVLWSLRKKPRLSHLFLPLYLIGYGVVRFFIEFFRQPDPQLGTVIGPFSMGQVLCFTMIIVGLLLIPIVGPKTGRP